jgi:pimeloyl-ACP methyl ester carboxylesterase
MRCRLGTLGVVLVLPLTAMPVTADVISIDPSDPPAVTLPPADAQLLQQLQKIDFPKLMSPLSPNGKHILTTLPDAGVAFLNVRTGQKVSVNLQFFDYTKLTEFRWLNNRILTYVGMDLNGAYHQIKLDRRSGGLTAVPMDLPGYPLSFSNRAEKLVLARFPETAIHSSEQSARTRKAAPPIKQVTLPSRLALPGKAKFEFEKRFTVPVTTANIACIVYDPTTGEETPLLEVPLNTAMIALKWSPRDQRLAAVRWISTDNSRSGQVSEESPEVQDALGNLPPEENPYFTGNALDLFHFKSHGVQHQEIYPEADDGVIFCGVDWDPHGMMFVAQMWTAGTPEGRTYPIYTHPNGSKYRFYLYDGKLLNTLDRPEIEAKFGQPHMISPFEMLIHAPHGLDFGVFRYNLFTQALTRLSTPPGSVYQMAVSPRRRSIVYNFSSYQQPYELYQLKFGQKEPTQLTHYNDDLKDLNQVRTDQVQFTLAGGAERTGFLIQPADGNFPPENIPMVVWQQGGPTAPMTQQWGSMVEMPFNLLPNLGMAVLVVPLPGRDGFGRDFLDALVDGTNFGQIDINEQAEIIDQMAELGYTSWDQIGVTGCSYGGYFASQSASDNNIAYAAANPQCSLLDLYSEWETGYTNLIAYFMGQTPDHQDEYDRDAPLCRAEWVETPTLIFAGTEDFLPSEFSREFHDRISAVGTPTDYYEFIGEPHGLYQPTSQFVAGQAQIGWFRNYLLKFRFRR